MLKMMKFDGKYARCNGSACYTSMFNMPVVQLAVPECNQEGTKIYRKQFCQWDRQIFSRT